MLRRRRADRGYQGKDRISRSDVSNTLRFPLPIGACLLLSWRQRKSDRKVEERGGHQGGVAKLDGRRTGVRSDPGRQTLRRGPRENRLSGVLQEPFELRG